MSEKKQVTIEMVGKAVDHCFRSGLKPSRGRVMAYMARPENGGCAGDPANVQGKIREYLAQAFTEIPEAAQVDDAPPPAQHEEIKAVLDTGAAALTKTWNDLDAGLARALAAIRQEAANEFEVLAQHVRQEAATRIEEAAIEETDALQALQEALEQIEHATEMMNGLKVEVTAANAIATDRIDRCVVLEAELATSRSETETAKIAAVSAAALAEERTGIIRGLEAELVVAKEDTGVAHEKIEALRATAAETNAIATDKTKRCGELEADLASARGEAETAKIAAAAATALAEDRAGIIKALETELSAARLSVGTANEQLAALRERVRSLEEISTAGAGSKEQPAPKRSDKQHRQGHKAVKEAA